MLLKVRELREDLRQRAALLARTHEAAERNGKDSRVHDHPLVERPPRQDAREQLLQQRLVRAVGV